MYWDRFILELRFSPHQFFILFFNLFIPSHVLLLPVTIEWVKTGQWGEDRTKTLFLQNSNPLC